MNSGGSAALVRRLSRFVWLPLLLAAGVAGCSDKAATPPGTGPSELGLSLQVQASPDVLDLDGLSQSQITVTARGPDSGPVRDVPLRLEIQAGGQIVDIGRLSTKNVTTGGDGRATVTYTSPISAPSGNSDPVNIITIAAIPVGTDYSNTVQRTVDIRLVPRGIILPEPFAPVPRFTISPTSPTEDMDIRFDASSSIASCVPNPENPNDANSCTPQPGTIVSYLWNFGNGRTGSGVQASTFYSTANTYTVQLTVTNDRGISNTATQEISIGAGGNPTAAFTASPQTVGVGQRVNVDASASQAPSDRFLIEYNWSWGDGSRSTGVMQSHSYTQAGSYTITLTVVDSSGRTGTNSQAVTVGTGQLPTAAFTFSPIAPRVGQLVNFDAATSTAPPGRTLVTYEWQFGDNSQLFVTSDPRPQHLYGAPGTYVVTLTVVDSHTARSTAITRNVVVIP